MVPINGLLRHREFGCSFFKTGRTQETCAFLNDVPTLLYGMLLQYICFYCKF